MQVTKNKSDRSTLGLKTRADITKTDSWPQNVFKMFHMVNVLSVEITQFEFRSN